jgi:pimeloyl-ACP methyl ester carboxylesterase
MAKIVMVHGAFNELWGPHELKSRWLPALRDGLWHHDVDIADHDVEVCFYGDLFRRAPGTKADEQLEQSRAGIADMLSNAAGGGSLDMLGQAASDAAFDRTVDMVTVMTTQADLRERLRARIEPLIDHDTRVVIAHSLGTVLSYAALCNHPDWRVHTFVTLGSPLGSDFVDGLLALGSLEGDGRWPGNVERWVNVRATGDKAAAMPLAPKFGPRVEDVEVDNGHRAHDPEPYLNSLATGAAVAAALRHDAPE